MIRETKKSLIESDRPSSLNNKSVFNRSVVKHRLRSDLLENNLIYYYKPQLDRRDN